MMPPISPNISPIASGGEPSQRTEKSLFNLPEKPHPSKYNTNEPAIEWLASHIAPDKTIPPQGKQSVLTALFLMVANALRKD